MGVWQRLDAGRTNFVELPRRKPRSPRLPVALESVRMRFETRE